MTSRQSVPSPISDPRSPQLNARILFFALVLSFFLPALSPAQTTITRAQQYYGLGRLICGTYSPDGYYILTGSEAGAFLWDDETSSLQRVYLGHSGKVTAVAFSRDGTRILTGSVDKTAKLWSRADGMVLRTFTGHTQTVNSVAVSPDGTRVVTGSDDWTAKVWDAAYGSVVHTLLHPHAVSAVAYSPDGTKILTGCGDNKAKLWDATSGVLEKTFSGHTHPVKAVAFSPDGLRILTGSADRRAKLWNIADATVLTTFTGHTQTINSVAFSPSGTRIVTGSSDAKAKVWDASSGTVILTLSGHARSVVSAAYSPDETRVLTASEDNTTRLWDSSNGSPVGTFIGHTYDVWSAAISPDGAKVVTGNMSEQGANLWNAVDGTLLHTYPPLQGPAHPVCAIAFSHDGTLIATGSGEHNIRLWRTEYPWDLIGTWDHGLGGVNSLAFSPNGTNILTGGQDEQARLWTSGGVLIHQYEGHRSPVWSVAFSRDGTKILTGSSDNLAKLWSVDDGTTPIRTFSGHTNLIKSVAFSPDGSMVLTGSFDWKAKLWNASGGPAICTFSRHMGPISSVAFSPDGTKVLTGSYDMTAKLWNTADASLIRTYAGHTGTVETVAFSPDGTRLLTAAKDGTARVWYVVNDADKVILVSGGGGTEDNNSIAFETQALADQAFNAFLSRGYTTDEIFFLSAFNDWQTRDMNNMGRGDGVRDADAQATPQAFWSAIDSWASDAARLVIYLIDHGLPSPWKFQINSNEWILASDLDDRLDALQAQTGGEVILIVDCCYSGGFVWGCTPPQGKRRIVISSTTPGSLVGISVEDAFYSFSFPFLLKMAGNTPTLWDCFDYAYQILSCRLRDEYLPLLDANGDGISDPKSDGDLARRCGLGRYPLFSFNAPSLTAVAPMAVVRVGEPVALWAQVDPDVPTTSVWAVLTPEQPTTVTTELLQVDLAQSATPGRWEGQWIAAEPAGFYRVAYFALNVDPLGNRLLSLPRTEYLYVFAVTAARLPWQRLR